MTERIKLKIDELVALLKEDLSKNATSFKLFVNCEEVSYTVNERGAKDLKKAGISMRNVSGEFIE
jgi:hypothetical protein